MEIKCGNVGKWLVPTCVRIPLCTHRLIAPGEQSSFFVWLLILWLTSTLGRYSAGSAWLLVSFALLLILVERKRLEFWLEPPGVPQVSPSSCVPASRGPWCLEAPWPLFLSMGHIEAHRAVFPLPPCILLCACCYSCHAECCPCFPAASLPCSLSCGCPVHSLPKKNWEKRIVCCVDCKSPRLLGSCLILVDYVEKNYS